MHIFPFIYFNIFYFNISLYNYPFLKLMYYLFDGFAAFTSFLISQRNEKKIGNIFSNWQHLLKLATFSQIGNVFSNWQRLLKLAHHSKI